MQNRYCISVISIHSVLYYCILLHGKQEGIPVGCQQPTPRPYMLHNENVSTYLGTSPSVQLGTRAEDFSSGGVGSLYGDVQCIMGNGHMGPPSSHEQADTNEIITFTLLWSLTELFINYLNYSDNT